MTQLQAITLYGMVVRLARDHDVKGYPFGVACKLLTMFEEEAHQGVRDECVAAATELVRWARDLAGEDWPLVEAAVKASQT